MPHPIIEKAIIRPHAKNARRPSEELRSRKLITPISPASNRMLAGPRGPMPSYKNFAAMNREDSTRHWLSQIPRTHGLSGIAQTMGNPKATISKNRDEKVFEFLVTGYSITKQDNSPKKVPPSRPLILEETFWKNRRTKSYIPTGWFPPKTAYGPDFVINHD